MGALAGGTDIRGAEVAVVATGGAVGHVGVATSAGGAVVAAICGAGIAIVAQILTRLAHVALAAVGESGVPGALAVVGA